MNKIKYFVLACICVTLCSCSVSPLTQGQIDIQKSAETAKVACYNSQAEKENTISTNMAFVPQEQIALVLVMTQMQESNKQMMAIATGNTYDPCATGTTAFDVQIAEVESKNKALSTTSTGLFGLGKWVVGAWAGTEIIDSIATAGAITIAGDGNSLNQNSFNTVGDENSLVNTSTVNIDKSTEEIDNTNNSSGNTTPDNDCVWNPATQEWDC